MAKPFIKWAGGKRQILDDLMSYVSSVEFDTYVEPFVGGGALFFGVKNKIKCNTVINDIIPDLIFTYRVVKSDVSPLIDELTLLFNELRETENKEKHYYEVRCRFNKKISNPIKRAAEFIYLNRRGYSGLYRANRKGEFNVPYGHYKGANFPDFENLRKASEALRSTIIDLGDFELSLDKITGTGFFYFDPPYKPFTGDGDFAGYGLNPFRHSDHKRLSQFARELHEKGHYILISMGNVDHAFIDTYYKNFTVKKVNTKRILSYDEKRKYDTFDYLISNFKE